MKSNYKSRAVILCIIALCALFQACNKASNTSDKPANKSSENDSIQVVHHEQLEKIDTLVIRDTIDLNKPVIDSLNAVIDSLEEDNLIKTIKLERIKQYNVIAGKGQNVVFLRGWINRVLKEE